ncbi:MAG: transcription termination factor NusA [Phycisphaerae bacterium]
MSQDLLRIIDSICRDKSIERESFVADLENAMASAIRKAYDAELETPVTVQFDPIGGNFSATIEDKAISVTELGRIAAQTAKQVIIQKTRERERVSIYDDFSERRGTVLSGSVVRVERGNLLVSLGRTEGFLPRSEQIPGETHQIGDRIRVLILEVREQTNQVKIILSRSHPEFILRLFEVEVPEVAERIIEIKALAREAGYRTKVAVSSIDAKVDAVGACVGVRGSRIKNIVEELGGEKIDIVRWNESSQILIQNALKPAEVAEIALCFELGKATVVVNEDQLSLAIGKRGQNVRLAARLTGWDIDIMTPENYDKSLETLSRIVKTVEGADDVLVDKLVAVGCVSVKDVDEIGEDPLVNELELSPEMAFAIAEACGEEVIRQEEEKERIAKEGPPPKKEDSKKAGAAATENSSGEGVPTVDGDMVASVGAAAITDVFDASSPTTETVGEATELAESPEGSEAPAIAGGQEEITTLNGGEAEDATLAAGPEAAAVEPNLGGSETMADDPDAVPRDRAGFVPEDSVSEAASNDETVIDSVAMDEPNSD